MSCRRSRGWRCSKALSRMTLLLGLIWFLWVGVLANEAAKLNAHHLINEGGSTKRVKKFLEINFVSKRSVPNGPDPIHNRRAGNSHRPPGRAQRLN